MRLLFTVLFTFSVFLLQAQTINTMKVKKPQNDSVQKMPVAGYYPITESYGGATVIYPDQNPVYPGGNEALASFLGTNKNNQLAIDRNAYGTVYTSFVIDTAGEATQIKITRGVDSVLDAEVIRLVSLMGRWQPGRTRGKATPVLYHLPIQFMNW